MFLRLTFSHFECIWPYFLQVRTLVSLCSVSESWAGVIGVKGKVMRLVPVGNLSGAHSEASEGEQTGVQSGAPS